ncbi:MAG: HlyD family secretion protein [Verrucomicrobia bacterium]|nr:HlyD family secretion protein [Verrucomicrobiota bacterium]
MQIGPAPGRLWGEGDHIGKDEVLAQLGQVDFKAERDSAAARAELARSRRTRGEQLLRDQAISPQEFEGSRRRTTRRKPRLSGRSRPMQTRPCGRRLTAGCWRGWRARGRRCCPGDPC